MGKHNTVESLSRMLQVVKLLAREGGATITQISQETGIDRWTVRDMIDSLDNLGNDGKGLRITFREDPEDKRKVFYYILDDNKWSLTLPGLNLSEDERMLLSVVLQQARQVPILKESANNLQTKMNWLKDAKGYPIININSIEKIIREDSGKSVEVIIDAIENDECLEFVYTNRADSKTENRKVMPLYMYIYDGGLYLVAQKIDDGQCRTYAFERIHDVPKVIKVKNKPERMKYDGRLEDPMGPFHDSEFEYEVEVKLGPLQGWYNMQKSWNDNFRITKNKNGTYTVKFKTFCLYSTKQWILKQAKEVISIKPDWLRQEIIKDAKEMLAHVESGKISLFYSDFL